VEADSRNRRVLGSWKEIATYLGKGVRTVQRWENDLGMPVRRPNGAAKGVVYASPEELDRWLEKQWAKRIPLFKGAARQPDFDSAVKTSQDLRRANQKLVDDLQRNLQSLRDQCEALVEACAAARNTRRMLARAGRVSSFVARPKLK